MNLRSLRGPGLVALGRLQEALGRRTGRLDWRLTGLLRQAQGRLYSAQAPAQAPAQESPLREARP
jgi:hypothetical protein